MEISIHALLAESDWQIYNFNANRLDFYPRSPCGERHPVKSESLTTYFISIHALLAESDGCLKLLATLIPISIHALLAESDNDGVALIPHQKISIHALLAESDQTSLVVIGTNCVISIHALLAESDYTTWLPAARQNVFLSTLSLRRATGTALQCVGTPAFLSTLSLRRATWDLTGGLSCDDYFYPRSPCGERRHW